MYIEIHWDEKKKRASCDSENEAFTLSIESSPVHVSSLHLVRSYGLSPLKIKFS